MQLQAFNLCGVISLACLSGCVGVEGNGNPVDQTRRLTDFSRIENDSPFQVDVTQGDSFEVVVRIDSNLQRFVDMRVHDDKLLIESGAWISDMQFGPHVMIKMPELASLENAGSGVVHAGPFEQARNLQLDLSGSGDLIFEGAVRRLDAAVHGSGNMSLSGEADFVVGSGDLDAFDLAADEADVSVEGSGDLRAQVDGPVDASTEGSGDIELAGDLEKGRFSERGSGHIRVR
jgi:hypothetical protein